MGGNNSSTKSAPLPGMVHPQDFSTNDRTKHGTPIYLNVYNLQDTTLGGKKKKHEPINSTLGFGFFHSGVEILGIEWTFGGHPDSHPDMPGVFPVPCRCALPPDRFHKQILLGEIVGLDQGKLTKILREIEKDWRACTYHLFHHNCNSFGEALVEKLNKDFNVQPPMKVPAWVNRAARFGDVFVPERIYKAMLRRAPQPPPGPSNFDGAGQSRYQYDAGSSSGQGGSGGNSKAEPEPEVKIPLATAEEMKSMSIKDIKTMMWVNGVSWDGCVEKSDLIAAVENFRKEQEALAEELNVD